MFLLINFTDIMVIEQFNYIIIFNCNFQLLIYALAIGT